MKFVNALFIRGLSWAGGNDPVLFVDGDLDPSTLPGSVSPLGASTQVVGRLVPGSVSGEAVVGDLREPLISSRAPSALLQDDGDGTLAEIFAVDPGLLNTKQWTLETTSSVTAAATSLVLTGPTAPTNGQILYLGSEAIEIDGAPTTSGSTHTCTVIRGACGSHAKVHVLEAKAYPPGDDGSQETLIAYDRQPFDDHSIEAAIYQFKMEDGDPAAVESVSWAWFGFVQGRPAQDRDLRWKVNVEHISSRLKNWTFPGAKEFEVQRAVRITALRIEPATNPEGGIVPLRLPAAINVELSRYEAEQLFNAPLHHPHSNAVDTTLLSTLDSRLRTDARVTYELDGTVGSHRWVWQIDQLIESGGVAGSLFLKATLKAWEPLGSAADSPVSFPAASGYPSRNDGLNGGFVGPSTGNTLIRYFQGEEPPKLTIRPRLRMTWPEAALTLLLSGQGGQVNHGTYDLLVGGRGLQLDPDWVNIGSTPGSVLSVDEGTTAWLELAALQNEVYDYAIPPETNAGDWFRNELLLHTALLAFVPTTGKIAARIWARKRPGSPTALNPIVGPEDIVESGERLDPVRAIFLERGINPLTLEPRFRKPLQLPETRKEDVRSAIVIRLWKEGEAFTDQELGNGPLARLERALFGVGLGAPHFYPIPVFIGDSVSFGDLPTWTDASIPTALGRGVTGLPVIVLGIDRRTEDGKQILYCLWDVVNEAAEDSGSAGNVAPALRITGVTALSSTRFLFRVASTTAEGAFNVTTSHDGIWQTIATANGRVRVVNPAKHNPSTERPGLLEASGTVQGLYAPNKIDVSFNAAWDRGDYTLAADIAVLGARILFQDYQAAGNNPEATTLQGNASQGYNGGSGFDGLQFGRPTRKPKFDGRKSFIGS